MSRRRAPAFLPRFAIVLVLAFAALITPAVPQTGQRPDPLKSFRQAMASAEESLQVGEMQLAESHYRAALFEGWMILGSLAEAMGDLAEA